MLVALFECKTFLTSIFCCCYLVVVAHTPLWGPTSMSKCCGCCGFVVQLVVRRIYNKLYNKSNAWTNTDPQHLRVRKVTDINKSATNRSSGVWTQSNILSTIYWNGALSRKQYYYVIHKTGSTQRIAAPQDGDRATAILNKRHNNFGEVRAVVRGIYSRTNTQVHTGKQTTRLSQ